jgi:predicted secreted acid phosphatase
VKLTIKRPARTTTIAFASLAAGMALTVPGLALATNSGQAVPAPPAAPTSADQIQNIDQVKTAIKAYYGETAAAPNIVTLPAPVAGTTTIHQFTADSAYAHETEGVAAQAEKYLAHEAKPNQKHTGAPAILFDIDDTTLNTYSYEIFSSFVYNPATNAAFVNSGIPVADGGAGLAHPAQVFPAVPGMVDLEQQAIAEGYQVFFLTGRPASQLTGTLANLRDAGYTVDDHNVYLKDLSAPYLQSCGVADDGKPCTTTEYKSLTRKYIESLGNDIVANFGDQFSDLNGGYADETFKIPNPMYYLP